ncbi:MAG: DNA primase [Spirochaetota bacterium]
MSIPQETIDTVRNAISIEQIISRYVPTLKKRGNNYVGLCPFHTEKTPSFVVSPDKQIFHCFGCHAGGNVFSFIQKIETVSFPESVRIVASCAGITIEERRDPRKEEADFLIRINEFAAKVFARELRDNAPSAREYLLKRGVSEESIALFRIGFAPDAWDFMKDRILAKKIPVEKALDCGVLSRKKETGRVFDTFRNRIIFPIMSANRGVVGFGGRIIGDGHPKYLNTSENMLFSKRNLLYASPRALDEIRSMGRAIVVEGYLDVIGCHQTGIENVVAPLGTALTREQLIYLSRYTNEIVLLFDADAAGMKASLRTLDHAKEINAVIRVARLPQGDPFEYVLEHGMRKLMVIIDNAHEPLEFKLRSVASSSSGRPLAQMFSIIDFDCELESEKRNGCGLAASILGLDKNSVLLDFEKYRKSGGKPSGSEEKASYRNRKDGYIDRSLTQLLVLLFHHPSLIEKAMIDFAEFKPDNELLRDILQKLFDTYENESEISTEKLFDFFSTDEEKRFLNSVVTTENTIENPDASYTEIYVNVKIHEIDGKISYYTHLLRNAAASGDSSRYLAEIDIWRREKEKLTSYLYSRNINRHVVRG